MEQIHQHPRDAGSTTEADNSSSSGSTSRALPHNITASPALDTEMDPRRDAIDLLAAKRTSLPGDQQSQLLQMPKQSTEHDRYIDSILNELSQSSGPIPRRARVDSLSCKSLSRSRT